MSDPDVWKFPGTQAFLQSGDNTGINNTQTVIKNCVYSNKTKKAIKKLAKSATLNFEGLVAKKGCSLRFSVRLYISKCVVLSP